MRFPKKLLKSKKLVHSSKNWVIVQDLSVGDKIWFCPNEQGKYEDFYVGVIDHISSNNFYMVVWVTFVEDSVPNMLQLGRDFIAKSEDELKQYIINVTKE